jgi:hypothetical protein
MEKRDRNDERDESKTDLESPLGIAGTPVTPDGTVRSSTEEEAHRRRQRGLSAENDTPRDPLADINRDHKGATGIDMGAGGHNTQVSDRGTKP